MKEFIFLIDRSGSMYNAIKLARRALLLFIQSLPYKCKFNVCSYGSNHKFMFPDGSVEYNDQSLEQASNEVSQMEANFGGTEIYNPLNVIFD